MIIGLFCKAKKFSPQAATKKYGVIIAARNEELVIGKLLESLIAQSYPKELYRIFVVADNCTDKTAQTARSHGAVVYERNEPERARKGYALNYIFEQIERDFGITSFDGYFFFDADNVVNSDYIQQVNNAFTGEVDAVVGYRNTKNFDQNFISAGYGIHFLLSSLAFHRPRSMLSLSTHIAGTGYMLASDLLKDGWNFELLTEDTEATMAFVCKGKKIEYCEAAELFDEQPTRVRTVIRQRLRWAKGRLVCFFLQFGNLIKGFFVNKKRRFSCYDMFFYLIPSTFLTGVLSAAISITNSASGIIENGIGYLQPEESLTEIIIGFATPALSSYLSSVALGAVVVIREHKHINCKTPLLVLYTFLWPWYDALNIPVTLVSLFMKVKWKPIKHDAVVDIKDISTAK